MLSHAPQELLISHLLKSLQYDIVSVNLHFQTETDIWSSYGNAPIFISYML